jgi:hypothetical protein
LPVKKQIFAGKKTNPNPIKSKSNPKNKRFDLILRNLKTKKNYLDLIWKIFPNHI